MSGGFAKRGLGALSAVVAIAALAPAGAQAGGLTVPQASQPAPVTVPHVEAQSVAPAPAASPVSAPTSSVEPAAAPSGNVPTSESLPGEPMGDDVLDSGNYGPGPSRNGPPSPPVADETGSTLFALFFIFDPPLAVMGAASGAFSTTPPAPPAPSAPKDEPPHAIPGGTLTDPSCPNGTWERVNDEIEDGGGADGCN